MGFYPAHPDAVAAIIRHLRLDVARPAECHILDPCCGEGMAIKQIAEGLGLPLSNVYAVELDAGRAEAARANLPGANIIGPAAFDGTQITARSFGMAYVNPPFDNELGGGRREELGFTQRATMLLAPKGVLALVVPFSALMGNRDFVQYIDACYKDVRLFAFPKAVRPFNELVVIGRRRGTALPQESIAAFGDLHKMDCQWRNYNYLIDRLSIVGGPYTPLYNGYPCTSLAQPQVAQYTIPHTWKPSAFRKVQLTEDELTAELARSPLNRILKDSAIQPPRRPPLPLDKGHVALLLASGMLDGVVEHPEYGTHVVRGTARKIEYVSSRTSETDDETGATTEKVTFSEKIVLTIRAVFPDGEIRTFSDEVPAETEGEEEGPNEEEYAT